MSTFTTVEINEGKWVVRTISMAMEKIQYFIHPTHLMMGGGYDSDFKFERLVGGEVAKTVKEWGLNRADYTPIVKDMIECGWSLDSPIGIGRDKTTGAVQYTQLLKGERDAVQRVVDGFQAKKIDAALKKAIELYEEYEKKENTYEKMKYFFSEKDRDGKLKPEHHCEEIAAVADLYEVALSSPIHDMLGKQVALHPRMVITSDTPPNDKETFHMQRARHPRNGAVDVFNVANRERYDKARKSLGTAVHRGSWAKLGLNFTNMSLIRPKVVEIN